MLQRAQERGTLLKGIEAQRREAKEGELGLFDFLVDRTQNDTLDLQISHAQCHSQKLASFRRARIDAIGYILTSMRLDVGTANKARVVWIVKPQMRRVGLRYELTR